LGLGLAVRVRGRVSGPHLRPSCLVVDGGRIAAAYSIVAAGVVATIEVVAALQQVTDGERVRGRGRGQG
jgi:hypothetical protein